MILVCLGVSILMCIGAWLCYYFSVKGEDIIVPALGVIGGGMGIVAIITGIFVGIEVSKSNVIDEQIAMYQEENVLIEKQIDVAVKQYLNYESGVFTDISSESSITLVSLYPELKSDQLIKKQIEVYMSNNEQIKSLKTEEINGNIYRWWLYFGG